MNEQRRRPMATGALGRSPRLSRGFTLIEMLISVALVLLMMVLFAEIFGLASESMTLQQAIADGDQQVRSFTTVFRSDIQKRTFQTLVPFDNQEDPELAGVPFSDRQGYLYISLNDPENATDNLLQFTVRSTIVDENSDDTEYFGKSTGIVQQNPAIAAGIASQNVRRNRQQPEHDDGDLSNNFTTSSSAAEIAYFMRAGRLYRRVVLIREPLISSGTNSAQPQLIWDDSAGGGPLATPKEYLRHNDFSTAPLVQTIGGQYLKYDPATGSEPSDDYWLDFDHGAYQAIVETAPGTFAIDGADMVGVSLLDNSRLGNGAQALGNKLTRTFLTDAVNPTVFYGIPRSTRFGFDQATGISREFSHASPSVPGFSFLGRFTLEEMSHPRFNFPQNPAIDSGGAVIGNPMSYASFPAAVDAGLFPNGAVDEFEGGSRRGQDLLLSNVHEFDIDIWDDSLGAFVKLGHQLSWSEDRNNNGTLDSGEDVNGNGSIDTFPGDYHRFRNNQLQAGLIDVPGNSAAWNAGQFSRWTGRTFDTWHPKADLDGDAALPNDWVPPPYRAMTYYPPASPSGPYASRGVWQPSTPGSPTTYAVGDIVFPSGNSGLNYSVESKPRDHSFYYVCIDTGASLNTEDVNGDGNLVPSEDANCNGVLDPGEDANMNSVLDLGEDTIRCNRLIDTNEPVWPAIDRALVERSFPGSGEPRWVARRNVKPLRTIRIRVRFFHESSGRMRQVSLVHSLVDEDRF